MIDPIGRQQAREAYTNRAGQSRAAQRADLARSSGAAAEQPTAEGESVQVSDGLRQIQHAVDVVKQSPDVRADKVAELRRRIESGEYAVSTTDVAAKMLGLTGSGN